MMNYKRRALLFILLITILFAGMYAILSIATHKMWIAEIGYIWKKYSLKGLITNLAVGLLVALVPYELIYSKISGYKIKPHKLAVVLLVINVLMGVLGCFVRRDTFYMESYNRRFQYIMIFFACLCMGIFIVSGKIENLVSRSSIRTIATVLNTFLAFFYSRNIGQAVIFLIAMTAVVIVYDGVIEKKHNLIEILIASLVGISGTVWAVVASHNSNPVDAILKMLYSIEKVDIYLGTGWYLLFILMAVTMIAVFVFVIKAMTKVSSVRAGFLMGAAALYVGAFVYVFLSGFDILSPATIEFVINRLYIVSFVLIIRCLVVIDVPKSEKNPSFIERVINSKSDEEDEEFDWIADKIEQLMRKQNTIIEYICVLDLKIEELFNLSCDDEESKKAKLREISDARAQLKAEGVPMNMGELVAKFNKISQKR